MKIRITKDPDKIKETNLNMDFAGLVVDVIKEGEKLGKPVYWFEYDIYDDKSSYYVYKHCATVLNWRDRFK
jgi:hypothetical protein